MHVMLFNTFQVLVDVDGQGNDTNLERARSSSRSVPKAVRFLDGTRLRHHDPPLVRLARDHGVNEVNCPPTSLREPKARLVCKTDGERL